MPNPLYIVLIIIIAIAIILIQNYILNKKIDKAYQEGYKDGNQKEVIISDSSKVTVSTLVEALAPISELATYEYGYANWDIYEKSALLFNKIKVPFINDKTIFAYNGKITAGIKDTNNITIQADNDKKKVAVYLPEPIVLHNEISTESFHTFDYKDSIFVSTNLSEYNEFMEKLKMQQQDELIANEQFWNNLKDNTIKVINSLLSPLLPEGYIVETHWQQ